VSKLVKMKIQLKRLQQLLLLVLPICTYSIEELYVQNLTCSNAYPIQLQSVTAECDDYCTLGTTANFGTWLKYSGVNMATAKLKVNVNFIPTVNLTKAYASNYQYMNFGIMKHDTHFSEVVDVCQDGYSCTNKGQFYFGFQYQLPSFGSSLNSIIDDYQLQFDIVSYDYDSYAASSSNKVLGNCEVYLTSDNSTIRNTVYAASNSSYFLFAAALIGTFAAVSTLNRKNSNKNEKNVFSCGDEDDKCDINAFQQMPSEFNCSSKSQHKHHTVPEKIFELKNYVSESATMFWEETHSWPRAGSALTERFTSLTTNKETVDDESSDSDSSSPFTGLEEGILSGSLVSVSDGIVDNTSSISHNIPSSLSDGDGAEGANVKNNTNNVEASFSCAVEGKEVNDKDENKFFVDDMKIIPSVDKQELKKLTLTETQSTEDDDNDEEVVETMKKIIKDVENDDEKAVVASKTNQKKKIVTKKAKSLPPSGSSAKKKNNSKVTSSASRFSIMLFERTQ